MYYVIHETKKEWNIFILFYLFVWIKMEAKWVLLNPCNAGVLCQLPLGRYGGQIRVLPVSGWFYSGIHSEWLCVCICVHFVCTAVTAAVFMFGAGKQPPSVAPQTPPAVCRSTGTYPISGGDRQAHWGSAGTLGIGGHIRDRQAHQAGGQAVEGIWQRLLCSLPF